jgi:ABC-type multidrug transport system permease subunit
LLGAVFGDLNAVADVAKREPYCRNILLLLAVSCFWFGCNTAAKELVKERLIFLRERDFNLRVTAYFASKFLLLSLIAAVQATLLFLIVRIWCHPAGSAPQQWAVLTALAVAGTSIGLFVSAVARSEEVAIALLPIIVIPQLILADVVARLSGIVETLAKACVSVYWGQWALDGLAAEADSMFFPAEHKGDFWGPLLVILAHAAVGAVVTVVVLSRTEGKRT